MNDLVTFVNYLFATWIFWIFIWNISTLKHIFGGQKEEGKKSRERKKNGWAASQWDAKSVKIFRRLFDQFAFLWKQRKFDRFAFLHRHLNSSTILKWYHFALWRRKPSGYFFFFFQKMAKRRHSFIILHLIGCCTPTASLIQSMVYLIYHLTSEVKVNVIVLKTSSELPSDKHTA